MVKYQMIKDCYVMENNYGTGHLLIIILVLIVQFMYYKELEEIENYYLILI